MPQTGPVVDDGSGNLSYRVTGGGGGGGGAVTVADGDDVALGATTDAEETSGTGHSLIAVVRNLRTRLATLSAKTADYDTGAGSDTVAMVGVAFPASGGAVAGFTTSNPGQVSMATGLNSTDDTVGVVGTVAHDGVDSGNPVKVGFKARTTNPTAVSDGDRADATSDKIGRQVVVIGQVRDLRASQRAVMTDTTETTIVTAAASVFHDLRGLILANGSTTDVEVDIRDDTGGTVIMTFAVKAGTTGGAMFVQSTPQTATNKNWTAKCSASPSGGGAHLVATAFYETNV